MDKELIREAIIRQLTEELTVLVAAAETSKREATDQDSRQEGKYDMRAQSAAYLAEGQSKLALELAAARDVYRTLTLPDKSLEGLVTVGSLVSIQFSSQTSLYFIGPTRGGIELNIGDSLVTVITAGSPVGRQLLNKKVNDTLVLGKNTWKLVSAA